jgi:hypothetical protein
VSAPVLEQLAAWCRIADEIGAIALANIFGTTPGWVSAQAVRRKKGRAPRLVCKRDPGRAVVRGADNRLLFDVEDVFSYVSDVERLVTRLEAPHLGSATLPLVTATDPRIGTAWNTGELFHARTATWRYGAARRAFGEPTAFFISNERRGYSVTWSDLPGNAVDPLAANDNTLATTHARGGAKP